MDNGEDEACNDGEVPDRANGVRGAKGGIADDSIVALLNQPFSSGQNFRWGIGKFAIDYLQSRPLCRFYDRQVPGPPLHW